MSLEKAAKRIRKILPWIPSEEVIIQFMSNLPECRPTERNILTIQHFISQHDKESVHEGDWLYEAFELRKLFPDMDEMIFYRSLSELGNIPNRLEIVVRQIINQPRPKDNAKRASTDISPQKNKIIKVNNNQWPNLEINNEYLPGIPRKRPAPCTVTREADLDVQFQPNNGDVTSTGMHNVQYIQQPETDTHNTVMELLQLHPNNLPDDLEVNQVYALFDGYGTPEGMNQENLPGGSGDSSKTNDIQKEGAAWQYNNLLSFENIALNAAIDNNPPPTAMNEVPTTSQGLPSMVDAVNNLATSANNQAFLQVPGSQAGATHAFKDMPILEEDTSKMNKSSCMNETIDEVSKTNPIPLVASQGAIKKILDLPSTSGLTYKKKVKPSTSKHPLGLDLPLTSRGNRVEGPLGVLPSTSLPGTSRRKQYTRPVPFEEDHSAFWLPRKANGGKQNGQEAADHPRIVVRNMDDINGLPDIIEQENDADLDLYDVLTTISGRSRKVVKAFCYQKGLRPRGLPANIDNVVGQLLEFQYNGPETDDNFVELDLDASDEDTVIDVNPPQRRKDMVDKAVPSDNEKEATASGPSNAPITVVDNQESLTLGIKMMEMFPDACPNYLRSLCENRTLQDLNDIVTMVFNTNDQYPRRPVRPPSPEREVDPVEQFEILKGILPDADPTYLQMQCERYRNDREGLKQFIENAVENKGYPTLKEYNRRLQLSAQQRQYTTEFDVKAFVQLFPDPFKTFATKGRPLPEYTVDETHYITMFMRNLFDKLAVRDIATVMNAKRRRPYEVYKALTTMMKNGHTLKSRRRTCRLPDDFQNIPLLQELAFLQHKDEIKKYIQEMKAKEQEERRNAKEAGLMRTCNCCYDEEVMPKDYYECPKGCGFCRECVLKSCEIAFGDGKIDFPCLADCGADFTLHTLQECLPPKMFSKIAQKKTLAEVKAAGIEELESCPFCDFATIPYEADKIFRCLNPDCMKESCRLCKEASHVPLKCEEVEKDEEVRARTYIENKMTEALLRKCHKCGASFFKEEGCNKMTCSCGAMMCYICGKPVKDYTHFNGIGGDRMHLCPLYSDTNKLNEQNVLRGAENAKKELGTTNLKTDPSADVRQHYEDRSKNLPREGFMDLLNGDNAELRELFRRNAVHRNDRRRAPVFAGFQIQVAANGADILNVGRRNPQLRMDRLDRLDMLQHLREQLNLARGRQHHH
ncbi:uncharacterized protein LOC109604629 isoform X6 [Aethina tumida]|uniref:uncharacterized protein LOC109604629 isoform X6 n=1 Tax=Aethina tumida TaxID=116153 RepID=UPI002147BBD6|nr:uncharacterized protein LOC109604629 isoform X6 [Aethina tumida]